MEVGKTRSGVPAWPKTRASISRLSCWLYPLWYSRFISRVLAWTKYITCPSPLEQPPGMEGSVLNSRTKAFDRKAREGFAKVAKKGQIEIRHYRMVVHWLRFWALLVAPVGELKGGRRYGRTILSGRVRGDDLLLRGARCGEDQLRRGQWPARFLPAENDDGARGDSKIYRGRVSRKGCPHPVQLHAGRAGANARRQKCRW